MERRKMEKRDTTKRVEKELKISKREKINQFCLKYKKILNHFLYTSRRLQAIKIVEMLA